jgi:hypothetical protein
MSGKQDYYSSSQSASSSSTALSRPVRRHLVNVYLTLAAMCAIATIGSRVGDYLGPGSSTLGSLGAVGSVTMFRFTSMNSRRRWALLAVSIVGNFFLRINVKIRFYRLIQFQAVLLYQHFYPCF